MDPDTSLLLDQLASGLLDLRRKLCTETYLVSSERSDATEHAKVALSALVNLRRILRRAYRRSALDKGAAPAADGALEFGKDEVPAISHGPSPAEWRSVHEELKNTDNLWRSLAFDGVQSDGCGGLLEYRRCPDCNSTLGRRISRQEALELCQNSAEVNARSLEALASTPPVTQRRKAFRT